jgi:DNA-binding NtrC family response regulator
MNPRILLVDDQPRLRQSVREFLELKGFDVDEAATCAEAEEAFHATRPDVVLLDYNLPDGDALDLLPKLRALDANVPLLILTGQGRIDLGAAIRAGAEECLTKPVELPTLLLVIKRLLEIGRIRRKDLAATHLSRRIELNPFVGTSSAIRRLEEAARAIAGSDAAVLIEGPIGSEKSVLAKWLHENSARAGETFVDLNCAGLSREFLERELSGFEPGAFTEAVTTKPGLFELAHRGTIFLDEFDDLDPAVQAKILEVQLEKRARRLSAVRDRQVDIRLIAATHRKDLDRRLSMTVLEVPPLCDRAEDIVITAREILPTLSNSARGRELRLTENAEAALRAYSWPGDVRELRNVLERAVLLTRGNTIDENDLGLRVTARPAG